MSWAIIAATCLLLGGGSTVAVVAGLTLSMPRFPRAHPGVAGVGSSHEYVGRTFYEVGIDAEELAGHGMTRDDFDQWLESFNLPAWVAQPRPDEPDAVYTTVAAGWPMPALKSVERRSIGQMPGRDQPLPCVPIWRGVVLDTLLYAAVWLLIIGLPVVLARRVRAARRARLGKCPICAYNLAGTGIGSAGKLTCPECGSRLRVKIARTIASNSGK